MKKLAFVLVVSLLTSVTTFAQYTPKSGSVTTELQFNPLNLKGTNNFSVDGLKLRYFFNEHNALRVNLGFGYNSDKITDEIGRTDITNKYSYGSFDLSLGYEYHFNIAPRLSIYLGGATGFETTSASTTYLSEGESTDSEYRISGRAVSGFDPSTGNGDVVASGGFEYNLQAFTGIDFYMYKGLYAGAEFGLKFSTFSPSKVTTKTTINNSTTEVKNDMEQNVLSLGFYAVPQIRLGWKF